MMEFKFLGTPLPPVEITPFEKDKDGKEVVILLPTEVSTLIAPSIWASRIDGHQWLLGSIQKMRAQLVGPALVDRGEWGGMILTMPVSTLAQQYEWKSNNELYPWDGEGG